MAIRRRRSSRMLEDLPGLFDEVSSPNEELFSDIIEEHRKKQTSTSGLRLDIENGDVMPHRQLQFISFGSGSSGNCAYVGIQGEGGIIIDAGVDTTRVLDTLHKNAIPLDKISGILLTHDHSDHVRYAYPLMRKLPKVTLYCTQRVITGILRKHSVSRRIKDFHKSIFKEFAFEAGPFTAIPFEVSHDGSDNAGYILSAGDYKFVIATDMGEISARADFYIRQANFLMIEANYDAAMLAAGSYPEYLKSRIRGPLGHLNNTVTASYLRSIWNSRLTDIYLCHLSNDNNRPEIAIRVVKEELEKRGLTVGDASGSIHSRKADVRLCTLPRFESSPLYVHRI